MKPLKPYKVLRALKKLGFFAHHQTRSHIYLHHPIDKTMRVCVAYHKKELPPKTLKSILDQAGISEKQLQKFL